MEGEDGKRVEGKGKGNPPPPHPICQCVSVYLSGWANRMTDGQTDEHMDIQTEGPPFPQKEAK